MFIVKMIKYSKKYILDILSCQQNHIISSLIRAASILSNHTQILGYIIFLLNRLLSYHKKDQFSKLYYMEYNNLHNLQRFLFCFFFYFCDFFNAINKKFL